MLLKKYAEYKRRAKEDYKDSLRYIYVWDEVEKKFSKQHKNEFQLSFKHPEFDNELKIEAIAGAYGFKIIDEVLGLNYSTYYFKKTSEAEVTTSENNHNT